MLIRLLIFSVLSILCGGKRIKDNIYTNFGQIRPCFRRLNGTHEIGCTSSHGGNVGVVQVIESDSDISLVQDDNHAPYIVVVKPSLFSGSLMNKLKKTGNVNGVVLPGVESGRWAGMIPEKGSDDMQCPNRDSSLYKKDSSLECGGSSVWNPAGQNLMFEDWGFPIFLVENSTTTDYLIEDCFEAHNKIINGTEPDWPLCSVELKSNMYAAVDSETCMRRSNIMNTITPVRVCDPLSDNNIIFFLKARNGTSEPAPKDNSVILVTVRLDALNMFDQVEVGFDSPVTGIVTLLSAAKLVKKAFLEEAGSQTMAGIDNVLFLFLHGESFDYIGSSRLVYDMEGNAFPYNITDNDTTKKYYNNGTQPLLNLRHIHSIIEIGQVSNKRGNQMYFHTDEKSKSDPATREIIKKMKSVGSEEGINMYESTKTTLPPASAQTFLKKRRDIPTVMITNYDAGYVNNLYHSIYDNAKTNKYNYSLGVDQDVVQHIAKVSKIVAQTVYTLATDKQSSSIEGDESLVNEMLNCYTFDANCTMFYESSVPESYPWTTTPQARVTTPWPQYVGVRSSFHTVLTKQTLQYLTGDIVKEESEAESEEEYDLKKSKKACLEKNKNQNIYRYSFLVGNDCYNKSNTALLPTCGKCYQTTVYTTTASSPAFLDNVIETYKWDSGEFPTWTESIWKSISGRIFLQSSPSRQYSTLAIGLIILLVSFILVWWAEKNSTIIFSCQPEARLADNGPVAM